MIKIYKRKDGFISLVGLILALVIVSFLVLKIVDIYVHKPVIDKDREKIMAGQESSIQEYDGILDNIRNQVDAINKKAVQREKELESIF